MAVSSDDVLPYTKLRDRESASFGRRLCCITGGVSVVTLATMAVLAAQGLQTPSGTLRVAPADASLSAGYDADVDVLIVGGGVAGFAFADMLRHDPRPSVRAMSVRVIEQGQRIGGRLLSVDPQSPGRHMLRLELGGMRIFPAAMPLTAGLLARFNLSTLPMDISDGTDIFRYRGVSTAKRYAELPGRGTWAARHPSEMQDAALAAYTQDLNARGLSFFTTAYAGEQQLRGTSMRGFFKRYANASDLEFEFWVAYSGYDIYHDDIQAACSIEETRLFKNVREEFVVAGFAELVRSLHDAGNATVDLRTQLKRVERGRDSTGVPMVLATTSSGETIRARKLVLATTAAQALSVRGIQRIVSPARIAALRSIRPLTAFKCFLQFTHSWWRAEQFSLRTNGKSTTDSASRQIHYYDDLDNVLLIYNYDGDVSRHASEWARAFEQDRDAAMRKMFAEVKAIHVSFGFPEHTIPEPIWEQSVYKYWPVAVHQWAVGADAPGGTMLASDGQSDGSEVYFTGEAYSMMQGWVEGALQSTRNAYRFALAQP